MARDLVLFGALDTTFDLGLWVSDGTSAGTWELAVGPMDSNGHNDPNPRGFTAFGSEVLFSSWGGLWVTDGTSPGTYEISVAGANTYIGLDPGGFTKLGSEVLFSGQDSSGGPFSVGLNGLWVTDGTSAGTSELSVANANTSGAGLSPSDFTAFGTEVLFTGLSTTHEGLWVTNGTSAGTSEILDLFDSGVQPTFAVVGNRAFFGAPDALGKASLWVTDGTSAGTSELVSGLAASDLITFGTEVLFAGSKAVNGLFTSGLWVTDGTVAGTSELAATYIGPGDLTVFGSKALFSADAPGMAGGGGPLALWVTDGTQAGTSELVQVAGASGPTDLMVFGSEALFSAPGANTPFGHNDLWVTDGTSAGTTELTAAGGAPIVLDPTNFSLFGSEVLFTSVDANGHGSLWVTDGTAAGTSEVSVAGLLGRLSPLTSFTQNLVGPVLSNVPANDSFRQLGAPVTLAPSLRTDDGDSPTLASATVAITGGTFANDSDALAAVTTGTAITASYDSTSDILTLSGTDTLANYQSVLDSITFVTPSHNPTNFGSDPTRKLTWVVNDGEASNNLSTVQTTTLAIIPVHEPPSLSGVAANASATEEGAAVTLSPALTVSDPDSLTLVDAVVSISGGTFAGEGDLLSASTAGTNISLLHFAPGVLELGGTDTLAHYQQVLESVTFLAGENPTDYGSSPVRTVTWFLDDGAESNDFSTTQTTTVSVTGINDPPSLSNLRAAVRMPSGHTVAISPALSVSDPDSLELANATISITGGTFAGDGDILAANTAGTSVVANYNSATETLTLSGTDTLADYQTVLRSLTFSAGPNPSNSSSNPTRTLTWVLNDGSTSNNLSTPATTTISIIPPPRNDLNADGMSDVLLQNTDGTPQVWLMNGASVTSKTSLLNPGPAWHLAATGDFNQDGTADLLWQNNDGTPAIWEMNGTSIVGGGALPNPGSAWHIIATGDFNGDGSADILFQNTDGAAAIWEMNGTSIIGGGVLPINPGPSWHVIGAGDVNGDGKADILWQNNDATPAVWEMNGTSVVGGGTLMNPGSSWHAIGLGDFNADGKADILWQNTDGAPAIWELNGTAIVGGGVLLNAGPSWHALGTSDVNGDGKADIVWQNTDGAPAIWEMNGTSIIGGGVLSNPGSAWKVKDDGPIPPELMGGAAAGSAAPAPNNALQLSAPDLPTGLATGLAAPKAPHLIGLT